MNALLAADHPVDESQFYGLIGKVISTIFNGPQCFHVPLVSLITGKSVNHGQVGPEQDLIPTYVLHCLDTVGKGHGSHVRDEILGVVEFKRPDYPIELAQRRMGDYCRFIREGEKAHGEFFAVLIHGVAVYEYRISGERVKVTGRGGDESEKSETREPMKELETILREVVRKLEGEDD